LAPLRGNPAILSSIARDVLAEAQEACRRGRLGFLVGAGLSNAIGLPGWNAFNHALVEQTFDRHAPGGSAPSRELARAYFDQLQGQSLAAVDFVRRRAGNDFHVVVRGALYERKELRRFEPTEVHHALCKLAAEQTPSFPCLHTTNYDDLLERSLHQVTGQQATPVHLSERAAPDGPRVIHLHGYFPFDPPPQAQKARLARELVLSDLDYSRLSNDHQAWTNRELLALLDARSVLIVGMSLTDPNVRRLFAYLSDRRRDDGPQHFVVLTHRHDDGSASPGAQASRLLDEDEYEFWKARGVKIIRLAGWDRLNYLLRRIRFSDNQWDRRHRELRIAWARQQLGAVDLDEGRLQALGTAALQHARDQLAQEIKLSGRAELNLFLPLADGSYRRAFASVRGRAQEAPRPFVPAHDRLTIPEVETALLLGQPILRSVVKQPPPPGQPPFQGWYKSLVSVPHFDDPAGGIPVAVIQLASADADLAEGLDAARLAHLRDFLREVVRQAARMVRASRAGRAMMER
jgi:hypothetical protein